jgi:hypothetical protein
MQYELAGPGRGAGIRGRGRGIREHGSVLAARGHQE